ncbi:MAG TPA: ATP synthase F1 subunit delta [Cyclobacteriaceae bacterium]|nr:ATP synthase F1 subunit delta [Cyclobacteriaceae bacterium]
MAESRAASRYVKSLLSLAVEQGALDNVHEDMLLFDKVCRENQSFRLMLKNPVIKHEKKRDILEKIFAGKVHPLTIAIFDIITRKNREAILPNIARDFHNAYNEFKNISKATLTTAFPIDNSLKSQFETIVKKLTKNESVELVEKLDKDMIGGFILDVGDKQIDASLKNKLKMLKVKFSHNPYVKEF